MEKLINTIMWIVGVLVSLSVGFGMTSKVLVVPFIPEIITVIAGWIVVAGAIIGVVIAIIKAASKS